MGKMLSLVVACWCLAIANLPSTEPKRHPRFQSTIENIFDKLTWIRNELGHLFHHNGEVARDIDTLKLKLPNIKKLVEDSLMLLSECRVEGAEYYAPHRMCYLLETRNTKSWNDARQDCQWKGGDLAQPYFGDTGLFAFLKNTLSGGALSVDITRDETDDVYFGAIASADGTTVYLNNYLIPNENSFMTPVRGSVGTIIRPQSSAPFLTFREIDGINKRGYLCEFRVLTKVCDRSFSKRSLGPFEPNLNDIEGIVHPLVECDTDNGKFLIGHTCYKFFAEPKSFVDAMGECVADEGELATVPQGRSSRLGAVVADLLSLDEITQVWVAGKDDGEGRLVPSNPPPPSGSKRAFAVRSSSAVPPPEDDFALAVLLPVSTPDDISDNREWSIIYERKDTLFGYLCQYSHHKVLI